MSRPSPARLALVLAAGLAACGREPRGAARPAWTRVGDGSGCGVSALVAVAVDTLLLLHDNRGADEPRLALLVREGGRLAYRPVAWRYDAARRARDAARLGAAPDSLPDDLEAAARVPGAARAFVVVTSRGVAYRLTLDASAGRADVEAVYAPAADDATEANYEGFVALAGGGDTLLGVWAERGGDARAGVLRWGPLAPGGGPVALRTLDSVRAAWPTAPEVRHLADLALDGATLLAASASDGGRRGPFASGVVALGRLTVEGGAPVLRRSEGAALRLAGHKVEAIVVLPGDSLLLGADDERRGGLVVRAAVPRGGDVADLAVDPRESAGARARPACRS